MAAIGIWNPRGMREPVKELPEKFAHLTRLNSFQKQQYYWFILVVSFLHFFPAPFFLAEAFRHCQNDDSRVFNATYYLLTKRISGPKIAITGAHQNTTSSRLLL
ncbi:hypothetical protein DPMN_066080 [Dreissena polymorpha]|uniref:Uncharacterized protein n=1 Tax=Dreissena polymorpha TaxID=45954 RepID=A0A9D3YXP5_DREPO|nr:hypothetical protein DPMN_066080 [Dreissena polymorpha]